MDANLEDFSLHVLAYMNMSLEATLMNLDFDYLAREISEIWF